MNKNFLRRCVPIILIFISFIVYFSTICPTVYLGDSGELTTAAFSLGIPHASGYPLYALIGKLFCLVPIGNIGFTYGGGYVTLTIVPNNNPNPWGNTVYSKDGIAYDDLEAAGGFIAWPEPATIAFLGLGGLALLRRRGRRS